MATRARMEIGEWYHCYTRGVDKRTVFEDPKDFERFLVHLFVGNGTKNIRVSDLPDTRLAAVLTNSFERGESLVELGAYTLMPNHMHFVIRENRERGIATFMQKVFTGYTMYFNNKYKRTGALFSGTFKSKHINDDRYLKQLVPYVLLNPIELFEPRWKTGGVFLDTVEKRLREYEYSSLPEFLGIQRARKLIISGSLENYYDRKPSLREMLKTAQEYYQEHSPQV